MGQNRIESYTEIEADMRTTRQMSITLSKELADAVKARVASGEYATESEVIRDGLRALMARDRAVDHWLRETVAPALDAARANPSRVKTTAQVRASLATDHEKMREK
jgi:putative addiction module CopG family antidote